MGAYILRGIDILVLVCLSFSIAVAQENKIKSEKNTNELNSSSTETLLPTIIIRSSDRKYKVSGDTISYPVSAYLKVDIKKAEDLFKQLEGFKVDDHGKIFFNGKEITRVLLDGEDMVGEQYQILSKNIQAGLLDKVHVYTHHNQNRLLKDVEQLDQIAVDLRFREDKKNRLNGSVETGYGIHNKHTVDIDAVGIFNLFKLIGLADKNNIGLVSTPDQYASYNESDQVRSNQNNKYQSNPLVAPIISLPDIPVNYTLDNNDRNLSLIGSFKVGSFKKIKVESSISNLKKINNEQRNIQFLFPGSELWNRMDIYHSFEKRFLKNFKFNYINDRRGNRISNYELTGSFLNNRSEYSTLRSGTISDNLDQAIWSFENFFSIKGTETFKLKEGFVFNTEVFYAFSDLQSDLTRSSSNLFLTPEFDWTNKVQGYDAVKKDKLFTSSLYKAKGRFNAKFSIQLKNEEKTIATVIIDKYSLEDNNKYNIYFNAAEWKSQGSIGFNASKKIFMQADLSIGDGQVQFKKKISPTRTLFNLSYYLSHQKSPFNRWVIEMSIIRKAPSVNNIFPSPLLGHNSTILLGISTPSFPLVSNLDIHYQRSDFYRGLTFSGTIAGSSIRNENSTALYSYPDYMIKSFFISDRVIQFRNNVQIEKYFNKKKLKTILTSNAFFMKSPERINNIDTVQTLLSKDVGISSVTNWKKILNIEFGSSFINNSIFGGRHDYHYKKSVQQFRNYLKFKTLLEKNIFVSFQFSSMNFNDGNTFYAGNGVINWKFVKSIDASVMFHNLFNKSSFFEKQNDLYGSMSRMYFVQRRYILFSFQFSF